MRNTFIIVALTVGIAVFGLGLKVILFASPDADAESALGSTRISPEEILKALPHPNALPIAVHDNAI